MDQEKDDRGFKVQDRRRFSATGEAREGGDAASEATAPPPPQPAAEASAPPAEISFSGFLLGLSTQVLVLLGEMADPTGQAAHVDLGGAKHLIDILGMLQTKTKGNLDPDESQLLDTILYDLRMRYVERARRK